MNVNTFSYILYTQSGHTPLSLACENGLSDVAQLLINKGANFDVTDMVSYYFHINNSNNASHFVIYLTVKTCSNVNIFSYFLYTQNGHTPLSLACVCGLNDVAQLLIYKGASFNVTDRVSYFFYLYAFNLNSASHFVIYFTVRACVNVNIFSYFLYTQNGHTPLSWACESGLSDVAQLLINKGASFDVTDRVSFFYLYNLSSASHFVIYFTVRAYVNVNVISYFLYTQDGKTTLLLACAHGLSDVAQLLINKGASYDVTDRVSYFVYLNNLNSASHFVIYFTERACVNVDIF